MFIYSWASVEDGGPTINQHRVDIRDNWVTLVKCGKQVNTFSAQNIIYIMFT